MGCSGIEAAMSSADSLLGLALLVFATVVFAYYTVWVRTRLLTHPRGYEDIIDLLIAASECVRATAAPSRGRR